MLAYRTINVRKYFYKNNGLLRSKKIDNAFLLIQNSYNYFTNRSDIFLAKQKVMGYIEITCMHHFLLLFVYV